MWIDFKLYFYVRIHKHRKNIDMVITVVNWFQIVFLREDSQANRSVGSVGNSCELISNCIFTWGFTRDDLIQRLKSLLWIDFKLYFYVRIHKLVAKISEPHHVVNWFQIVFLREDSQEGQIFSIYRSCCELISNCIFTWGFTSNECYCSQHKQLWIDFKLYFYVRIHKCSLKSN